MPAGIGYCWSGCFPNLAWAPTRTNEHPDDWPKGVRAISQEGLTLFGIKESTGQLYWDGAQVKTRNLLSLGTPERWMAGLQRSVLSARSQSTSHVS
jgi:hypothetical protein